MPTKTYDPDTGRCLVEFRVPSERKADEAWLAGEFNDWSTDACPLDRNDDGSLSTVVALEPGHTYRFRYYFGGDAWENDWAADAYADNDHGGSDSVVSIPVATSAEDAAQGQLGDGPGPQRARRVVAAEHDGEVPPVEGP